MIIRTFQAEDCDAILQLMHDVVRSVGVKYYDEKQIEAWAPQEGYDREKLLHSLMKNISYVALEKDVLIGFGDMTLTGYIDHLYVHKNYQGQGVARNIFRQLEKDARELRLKEL